MSDRIEKIRALLDSPSEGERSAARAALDRMAVQRTPRSAPPAKGTAEWDAARMEHLAQCAYLFSNLGSPLIRPDEITLIRNCARNAGEPFNIGAFQIESIYRRVFSELGRNR